MSKSINIKQLFITSWDATPTRKRVQLVWLLTMANNSKLSSDQRIKAKVEILQALCRKPKFYPNLTAEQLMDSYNDLSFLREPPKFWVLPFAWYRCSKWIAPAPMFEDITYYQFTRADGYLARYFISEKMYWAKKAFTVMYRPRPLSLRRKPYNELTIEREVKQLENFPELFIMTFIYSFMAMREKVLHLFKHVFPKAEEGKNHVLVDPLPMYDQQMIYLSHSPAYPGMTAARNALFYDALKYLNERLKHEKSG